MYIPHLYTEEEIIKMCQEVDKADVCPIRYIKFDYGITYAIDIYDSCYKRVDAEHLEETLYDIFIHGGHSVKISCIEVKEG
jgi:hypothetical protein